MNYIRNHINSIITYFLLAIPFLDVITAFMENNFPIVISIGGIIKILFLFSLIIYVIVFNRSKHRKKVLLFFGIMVIYIIIHCLVVGDDRFKFDYIKTFYNLVKVYYYPIILCCMYCIYTKRRFHLSSKKLSIILIIYLVFIIVPLLSNTAYDSYEVTKTGTIGWYYSANEISAIIAILLPFLFLQIHRLRKDYLILISLFTLFIILLFIGSKTPIIAFSLILISYLVVHIIRLFKRKNFKVLGIVVFSCSILIGGAMLVVPKTPFYQNIKVHSEYLGINSVEDVLSFKGINRFIFSDRLTFAENEMNIFSEKALENKFFGMNPYNVDANNIRVERKTVEIDYLDIFYKYGLIGYILYFVPIISVMYSICKKCRVRKNDEIDVLIYYCSVLLAFTLALMSGHVLVSPSVTIFLAAVQILLLQKGKEQQHENWIFNC